MKKILTISFCILLLQSCTCYVSYISVIEYSKLYDMKDFFVTESNSVSFDYKPLGTITSVTISGFEKGNFRMSKLTDTYRELFKSAIMQGANGIINVHSTYDYKNSMCVVSGMMILK